MATKTPSDDVGESRSPSRTGERGLKADTVFSVLTSTTALLIGTVAGFVGASRTTSAQLAHDAAARHQDQMRASCSDLSQAMRGEITQFNGAWLHASINDGRDLFQTGNFSALMGAQGKMEDTVPGLYLVASPRIIADIKSYEDHASQARQLILGVELGTPTPDRAARLDRATKEIDAAGAAQTKLLEDCRTEILTENR